MDIALMNVKISVQKNTVVTDEIGNHKNTWLDYYSCHATVSAESPKENTSAGVVVDDGKLDFTIRWCRCLDEMNITGYRVVFREEMYNILGIDHLNFKKKAMKLHCQKVRR